MLVAVIFFVLHLQAETWICSIGEQKSKIPQTKFSQSLLSTAGK